MYECWLIWHNYGAIRSIYIDIYIFIYIYYILGTQHLCMVWRSKWILHDHKYSVVATVMVKVINYQILLQFLLY